MPAEPGEFAGRLRVLGQHFDDGQVVLARRPQVQFVSHTAIMPLTV
jgi:hypothetical protein